MKKYRKAIQVGDNIAEIMMLPCIRECEKEVIDYHNHYENGSSEYFRDINFIYTTLDGKLVHCGDYIVQDVCENWHVMKPQEYASKKNEEIKE